MLFLNFEPVVHLFPFRLFSRSLSEMFSIVVICSDNRISASRLGTGLEGSSMLKEKRIILGELFRKRDPVESFNVNPNNTMHRLISLRVHAYVVKHVFFV